jgi:transposase-like protein
MSDEFYCPQCRRYKPLSCKSEKKSSSTWLCTFCNDKLNKKLSPKGGHLASLTQQQLQKGRDNSAAKRREESLRRQADARARELDKILKGD